MFLPAGVLLHGYVGLPLIVALSSSTGARSVMWILLMLSGAIIVYGMRRRRGALTTCARCSCGWHS